MRCIFNEIEDTFAFNRKVFIKNLFLQSCFPAFLSNRVETNYELQSERNARSEKKSQSCTGLLIGRRSAFN